MKLLNLKLAKSNIEAEKEKQFNIFNLCWFMLKDKKGVPYAFGLGYNSGKNFIDCKTGRVIDLSCGKAEKLGYAFTLTTATHFDYASKVASDSYKIKISPIKFKLNNAEYSVMPSGFVDVEKLWQSQSYALSGFSCDRAKLYIDKNLVYTCENVGEIYFENKIDANNVPFVFINLKCVKNALCLTNKNIFKLIKNNSISKSNKYKEQETTL